MRPERLGPRTSRHARTPPRRVRGGFPGARASAALSTRATSDMYARRGEQSRKPRQAGDRPRRRRRRRPRRLATRGKHPRLRVAGARSGGPTPRRHDTGSVTRVRRLLHGAPLLLCLHRDGGLSRFLCRGCSCPKLVHLCMRHHPTSSPSHSSSTIATTKISTTAAAALQLRATLAPIHPARLRSPTLLLRLLLGAHQFKYVARISAVRSTSRERRRAAVVLLHPMAAAAAASCARRLFTLPLCRCDCCCPRPEFNPPLEQAPS